MWEIELIKAIHGSGGAFLNEVFKIVTMLGEEMLFIAFGAGLYWLYNKRFAYCFMFSYFGSALCVSAVKPMVKRPRPFTHEGVVSIGAETHGYSFPSGHSQSAAAVFSQLAREFGGRYKSKRLYIYIGASLLIALTMFSRMYLAQHFLTDVLVGATIGVVLPIALTYLFNLMGNREELFTLLILPVFVVLIAVLRGGYDQLKDLYVATGAFSGVSIGYLLDKRLVKFELKAKWWVYIVRFVAGILVALAIKEGLKAVLPKNNLWVDLFRYFCMGIWASVGLFCAEIGVKRLAVLISKYVKGRREGSAKKTDDTK